jgi:hypothetical protein
VSCTCNVTPASVIGNGSSVLFDPTRTLQQLFRPAGVYHKEASQFGSLILHRCHPYGTVSQAGVTPLASDAAPAGPTRTFQLQASKWESRPASSPVCVWHWTHGNANVPIGTTFHRTRLLLWRWQWTIPPSPANVLEDNGGSVRRLATNNMRVEITYAVGRSESV